MKATLIAVAVLAATALLALTPGCTPTQPVDPCERVPTDGGLAPSARINHFPETVHFHTATCDDPQCGNAHNPPTGGPHCPTPLSCQEYSSAQLRCQWVHNLEHGHAVLLYNCPDGCPDVVSALEDVRAQVPPGANGLSRVVITPDPDLGQRVGAVVWGWSFSGDAVDTEAIGCLLQHQDSPEAPEAGLSCF